MSSLKGVIRLLKCLIRSFKGFIRSLKGITRRILGLIRLCNGLIWLLKSLSELSFQDLYNNFREQIWKHWGVFGRNVGVSLGGMILKTRFYIK